MGSNAIGLELDGMESFGQSEWVCTKGCPVPMVFSHRSLTSRLRSVLEMYPDGPGIINEVNAASHIL